MEQNTLRKQRELTDRLNRYRNEYYNYNNPSVSDEVYDRLFDELHKLEQETGIQMSNSPTVTVGYPVVGKLEKTAHKIPLLSLDKVKSSVDLCRFMGEHQVMIMLKLDGLTIKLTYENGELVEAATRGDGDEGEIVTHNARAISGIPAHIQYPGRLVVTGEAFIRPRDFERLNTSIVDENGETYKNGRNLAAGSVRLRDAGECMERCVTFMPFNVLEGFDDLPRKSERLKELRPLGFTPCKYLVTKRPLTQAETEDGIKQLQQYAKDSDMMTVRRTASSLKRSRPGARESAAASFCMVRITCRKPSTASTPNYNREVHTMTIIKINGGFWGWEPIETLERLYPLFEQYTLDPIYEWYGNFVNRKPEWQRSEERQAYQGCTVISGRFLHYGNFFYIVTDEEELIQRFERLVADNKATQAYQDERKVCFPCSECNQWSAASGLCGLTGRYRQPQWECFARYVLPKGKVEGDGANMRIELPIPEKAGKKAVLIGRGQWEV